MMLQKTSDLRVIPNRIVSLVPSQTELLSDLGLETETLGITNFCIHPGSWFQSKKRVGGTKKIRSGEIHQLKPDLIIANKEENVQEQVEELAEDYPVWLTDVKNLPDALQMITDIGVLTGKQAAAMILQSQIRQRFDDLKKMPTAKRTAYLIWRKPYMTIGADTFIHHMLTICGLENIFSARSRYPDVSIRELQNSNCEVLLLSSEPYPFKQKHIDELSISLPQTKIILVDGEFFSWFGSRLLKSPAYFNKLINNIR